MTTDIPALVADARKWPRDGVNEGPLFNDLADALEAEHKRAESYYEGLFSVYVHLGEDTDGARNAQELFGPMTGTSPDAWVPRLVAAHRSEYEREAEELQAERDRYRELYRRTELQCQDEEKVSARYRASIEEALESLRENEDPDTVVIDILTAALDETKGQD